MYFSLKIRILQGDRVSSNKETVNSGCLTLTLPLYEDDERNVARQQQYVFVEDDPLPLQREFATVRKSFEREYQRIAEQFQIVDKTVQKSKKTKTYVDEEWTVLPKAAAITVGGMAGFVLGLKRGVIGRSFTTAVGLATMAAFCYPYETVDVVRTGIAHSETAWERFKSCTFSVFVVLSTSCVSFIFEKFQSVLYFLCCLFIV
ncbi:unnamed protein product [Haemonchus placei]|uniref:MICOS complex subunit n=1 Tax=Haemonchus placei TaxID=6290 RepID=A0A0N4WGA3_HAEPC|nr:unnamed protein product [Haemonchus placei]